MQMVQRRRDDSSDSIEEVERDFGDGDYVKRKTTVREGTRRTRSAGRYRDYDDGYDGRSRGSDYYERRSRREYDDRRKH
jgi:hypothetical protein